MRNQNLFEALERICGFTALESDMSEIIAAYGKDVVEDKKQVKTPKTVHYSTCAHHFIYDGKWMKKCRLCGLTQIR
jgi:hypothetical protein